MSNLSATLNGTELGPEEDVEKLSSTSFTIMGVYLALVGTLATIGNLTVVITVGRSKTWRKKPQLLLIFNMALADLSISIFGYPLAMTSAFYERWMFFDVGCTIYAFMTFFCSMVSMNTLVALSLFRYIIICKPEHKDKLTMYNMRFVIASIWIYALGTTVPPLLGWSAYTYESFGVSCTMRWNGSGWDDISYIIFTCIFCYSGHLIVLFVFYGKISRWAKNLRSFTEPNLNGLQRRQRFDEIKASAMCFIMVLGFIVVWTPYAVISVIDASIGYIPILVKILPTMFAKSGPLVNPLTYTVLNTDFRKQIIQMWCRCWLKKVEPHTCKNIIQSKTYHGKHGEENDVFTVPYDKEGIYIGLCTRPVPICWDELDTHLNTEEEDKEKTNELPVLVTHTLQGNAQRSSETTTAVAPFRPLDEENITITIDSR